MHDILEYYMNKYAELFDRKTNRIDGIDETHSHTDVIIETLKFVDINKIVTMPLSISLQLRIIIKGR